MRKFLAVLVLTGCGLLSTGPLTAVEQCLKEELEAIESLPDSTYYKAYKEIMDRYEPIFRAYRSGNYEVFEEALEDWECRSPNSSSK